MVVLTPAATPMYVAALGGRARGRRARRRARACMC
jgi:hypothetical protein